MSQENVDAVRNGYALLREGGPTSAAEGLERLVEGSPVLLIKHGKIQKDHMRRELIRAAELQAAARRQGFESLKEIDEAVIQPGGTICFLRKEPTVERIQYEEIPNRLDRMSAELRSLGGTEGTVL